MKIYCKKGQNSDFILQRMAELTGKNLQKMYRLLQFILLIYNQLQMI